MKRAIIVAMSSNRVIGIRNTLPWHMPADMRHFKRITEGYPIIMGRKTFESIGKPLPRRTNILLSRQKNLVYPEGCYVYHKLSEAFDKAAMIGAKKAFIIGGSELYREALPLVDTMYITEIHAVVKGDTYFPEFSPEEWKEVYREEHSANDEHPYPYAFVQYTRSCL